MQKVPCPMHKRNAQVKWLQNITSLPDLSKVTSTLLIITLLYYILKVPIKKEDHIKYIVKS